MSKDKPHEFTTKENGPFHVYNGLEYQSHLSAQFQECIMRNCQLDLVTNPNYYIIVYSYFRHFVTMYHRRGICNSRVSPYVTQFFILLKTRPREDDTHQPYVALFVCIMVGSDR